MADLTLDISEVQIVVHYPGDENGFLWHHRILLHRIAGGTWLTLTPDLEIQRHDLNVLRHRVLNRAGPFPGDIAGEIYAHDPIGAAALAGYKREAQIQATILGEGDVENIEAFQWVIAEAGRQDFGNVVDGALLGNEATSLAFMQKGVVILNGEELFVERVMSRDLPDWRRQKGLDLSDVRLLGDHRDAAGKKRLDLKGAVALMRSTEDKEFPIHGVQAAKEFHDSVAASAGEFLVYHSEWVRLSGVSKKTSAAHIHRALCEALRLMHSFDQVDVSTLASGEHLTRWLIQTELVVERNPQQPDFSGLDIISGAAQLPDGRASTSKFTDWVSNRLKERAATWKQERLYNQERRQLRGPRGGRGEHGDSSDDEEHEGLVSEEEEEKERRKGGRKWRRNRRHGDQVMVAERGGGAPPGRNGPALPWTLRRMRGQNSVFVLLREIVGAETLFLFPGFLRTLRTRTWDEHGGYGGLIALCGL